MIYVQKYSQTNPVPNHSQGTTHKPQGNAENLEISHPTSTLVRNAG